jgi:phosphoribosylglycinamide formyltransferase
LRSTTDLLTYLQSLGEYNGAGAIERAFSDFKAGKITRTGIMVHYVVLEVDMGEPILTREVEIREGDDLAALEERMHASEHDLIVQATAKVARAIITGTSS